MFNGHPPMNVYRANLLDRARGLMIPRLILLMGCPSCICDSCTVPLLHLRFLYCTLRFIETTMSFADPNQALSRGNAVSTEIIPVSGLVLIIGVGVAGPA